MSSRMLSTEASSPSCKPLAGNKELEAERQWWSEASERQVKELESSFGNAFRNTADKLRNDLAACQERLERLLEAEKKQRNDLMSELAEGMNVRLDRVEAMIEVEKGRSAADVADLKQYLNSQQLLLTELARQGQDMQSLESRVEDRLHSLLRDVSAPQRQNSEPALDIAPLKDNFDRLRNELDSLSLQVSRKDTSFQAEWSVQRVQVTALLKDVEELQAKSAVSRGEDPVEAAVVDLRRELGEMRRDFKVLQESQQRQSQQQALENGARAQEVQNEIMELRRNIFDIQRDSSSQKNQEAIPAFEASVKDIRRDLAFLQEEQQRVRQKAMDASPKLQEIVPVVEASVGDLRRELAALREQQQQTLEAGPRLEEIRPVVEASIADIRRELQAVQREQESATSFQEVGVAMEVLRQDQQRMREELVTRQNQIEDLRASAVSDAKSRDEARGFQDLVMQSTCDLGRGLEEISASMVASEEKIRKEIAELRSPNNKDTFIQETCEKLTLELTALRAHLEVVCGQIADLQAQRQNSHNFAAKSDLDRLGALLEADVHKLEGRVEAIDERVRAGMAAAGSPDVEATQQVRNLEHLVNSCRAETNNLEEVLSHRLGDALAKDRAAYDAEFAELRHLMDAVVATQEARGVDELQETRRDPAEASSRALEEVTSDVNTLQMAVRMLEQKCLGIGLEGSGESAVPDLQAIAHRLDHADGEVRRLMSTMVILSSRVDTCENEVWRSLRDMPAMTARLDLVESDMKRLSRDSGTLSADIGVLRMIMDPSKGNKAHTPQHTPQPAHLEEDPNSAAHPPEGPLLMPQTSQVSNEGRHARFPNEEDRGRSEETAVRACPSPPQRCASPHQRLPSLQDMSSGASDPSLPECAQPVPSSSSTTTPASLFTVMNSRSTTEPPSPGATTAFTVPQHALPPVLSSDLKASISQLVDRVNQTLSSRPTGEQPGENLALTVQQALQDLREKNVSLREVNAGLVEELLAEGAVGASPCRTPEAAMKVPGTSPVLSWSPTKMVPSQRPAWQAIPVPSPSGSAVVPMQRYSLDSKLVSQWGPGASEDWKAPSSGSVIVPANPQMMANPTGIVPPRRGREPDASPVNNKRGASPVFNYSRGKSPVRAGQLAGP